MMFLSKKENYAESSGPLADGNKNRDRNNLLFICSLLFMIGGALILLHSQNAFNSMFNIEYKLNSSDGAKSVMAAVGLLIVYIGVENLLLILRKDQSKDQSHIDNHSLCYFNNFRVLLSRTRRTKE